ncbi:MAG: lytic transglycosylase domain-containing protein [Rubrivivax sp.]|nr:lytic transglycosylase domain-containing protein [Rubrivivax sp.]
MDTATLMSLLLACAPQVDPSTAQALISVESSRNPHAIGVVGGVLERQPRNYQQAVATAAALQAGGWNFSLGLAQINLRNLARLGLDLETAFDPCANLAAMQQILSECFVRSTRATARAEPDQHALRQALSCYYSGNFVTGLRHGYVRRIALQAHGPR